MKRASKTSNYIQLYIYRLPKRNHEAMIKLQGQIADIWKRNNILGSEFFQLGNAKSFDGFTNLAETVAADNNDEVWAEIQRYRDRTHRDEVVANIRKDQGAGQLFGQFYGLVTPNQKSVMGDFNRLKI